MKDDQIVILGKNADAYANNQTSDSFDWKLIRDARFAQLVAAAEREACANFLQEQCKGVLSMQANVVRDCVDALRNRRRLRAGGVSAQRVTQGKGHIEQDLKMVAVQEPFGYFKAEPFGWRDCAETDEGAIALYEAPQPQADARDAECFRFWVSEAARSPAAMAKLIMHCTTEDEYRAAITQCIDARKAAIAAAKENK